MGTTTSMPVSIVATLILERAAGKTNAVGDSLSDEMELRGDSTPHHRHLEYDYTSIRRSPRRVSVRRCQRPNSLTARYASPV